MNAELALEASEYLLAGEEIHMDRWKQVLAQLHWEGRMERIGAHITVDGAHNPGAMQAFVESVKALDESERGEMILLFSAVSDKKYDEMIGYLCGNLDVKHISSHRSKTREVFRLRNLQISSAGIQTDRCIVKNDWKMPSERHWINGGSQERYTVLVHYTL